MKTRDSFQLTSGGDLVTGGILQMQSRQKTFALSVSRDMMPEAHLVVWHIYQGEVIADAINFFVNGTRINNVSGARPADWLLDWLLSWLIGCLAG